MTRQPRISPEDDIPVAGRRFLLLAAATNTSKQRLRDEAGLKTSRLTMYERGENGPGDIFKKNLTLMKIAEVFGLQAIDVLGFWAFGKPGNLPKDIVIKIEYLSSLPAEKRLERWQDLGWCQKQGKPRKKEAAPPRAVD